MADPADSRGFRVDCNAFAVFLIIFRALRKPTANTARAARRVLKRKESTPVSVAKQNGIERISAKPQKFVDYRTREVTSSAMDRFAEMEMFVRVIEAGGFTEAARRSGVSKSAVSKQISALEQRLGARLLNRTTRRVSPTEIGLAYYDRASRVLAEASEADAIAASLQGAPRGELRISAPHSFGLRKLAPLVAQFLNEQDEVRVHMTLDDRFVELISEGYDLAVRIGALEDSSLKAKKIGEARVSLVAAPSYLRDRGAPTAIEDLADHDLLHYSYLASGRSWKLVAPNGTERVVRAGGRLTVNNGDALLDAAEHGLGIAMLPDFIVAESVAAERVMVVLPHALPQPLSIWAVTPPGRYMQPKVRVFIDFVAAKLKADTENALMRTAAE